MLIYAERYALGRRTYAAKDVIDYITPRLCKLSEDTLRMLDGDMQEAADRDAKRLKVTEPSAFGDTAIDKPMWMGFWTSVKEELKRRNRH